jgi:putative ABC transport system ATP-binding protein
LTVTSIEGTSDRIVEARDLAKVYHQGPRAIFALRSLTLDIRQGEWVTIVGPSGCGKSTLLNLLAGIDRPTAGTLRVAGQDLSRLGEEALARWRRDHIGIVFQFFQLMPTLTALENVELPLVLARHPKPRQRARALLEYLGIEHLAHHIPSELSGGEQQRVAIARALANDPPLLLADEPTGNLDAESGQQIVQLFHDLWRSGRTVILVTHDPAVAARAERVIELRDGRVTRDTPGCGAIRLLDPARSPLSSATEHC